MMGEQDLSPAGLLHAPAGPPAAVDDGADGRARRRRAGARARLRRAPTASARAILQVIVNAIDHGMDAAGRGRRAAAALRGRPRLRRAGHRRRRARGRGPHASPGSASATCSSAAARPSSATPARRALGRRRSAPRRRGRVTGVTGNTSSLSITGFTNTPARTADFLNSEHHRPTMAGWVPEASAALLAALAPRGRRLRGISSEGGPGGTLQRRARQGQEGRQGHVPGRGGRRLSGSRARPTTRSATWSPTRRSGRCTRSSPTTADKPVPDLAEGDRRSPKDNKTITVKLRSGVKFSPPVNREVTSKDVKYAFERAFTANVPSGYATSYFGDIKGAPDGPGQVQVDPWHQDAGRPHDRVQARRADRRDRRGRAGDADHDAGAAGVRGEVRQEEPVDV